MAPNALCTKSIQSGLRFYFFEDFLLFADFAFALDLPDFFPLRQPQVLHIANPFKKICLDNFL